MADVVTISGGPGSLISRMKRKIPKRVVFLSVNASTEHRPRMDQELKQPSISEAMSATTEVQLLRYNAATIDSVKADLAAWTAELSTPEHPVDSYFIEVSFSAESEQSLRFFLNSIPTSFNLTDRQVDTLIASGEKLLKADPEFQRLMRELQ